MARSAPIVRKLLLWFSESARDLPWRRTRGPYAIWVSEIMLQQTQVKTVIPYWERWMRSLPDLQSLAKASPQKIHKLWEGLGYYTRVRNMQRAAQMIVTEHGGEFPRNLDAVLALPGIGRYTAGAICSIAFNQPTPILDGNVIRVLTRVFGIKSDPRQRKTSDELWQIAEDLVKSVAVRRGEDTAPCHRNKGRARCLHRATRRLNSGRGSRQCSHFNQSLMELGALICTPKNARCAECPLKSNCVAHRTGVVHLLPNVPRRAPFTRRRFYAFVIKRNSRYLVQQRPAGVVNAHLWEFPNAELNGETDVHNVAEAALGFDLEAIEPLRTIKHTITRYRITLDSFRGIANGAASLSRVRGQWLRLRQLQNLPFSSAHKRILEALQKPS